MKKKTNVFRGLAGLTASLLCICIVATSIMSSRASFLNSRLGTVSYKVVNEGDEDTNYFKSEFSSLEELVTAKEKLAEEIAAEGAVLFKNENSALPLDVSGETVTVWGMNSMLPATGGMIGSQAAANGEKQNSYDIVSALEAKGFQLNGATLGLYGSHLSDIENDEYIRHTFFPGAGLVPGFTPTWEAPGVYLVGEIPPEEYTDDILASADNTAAICVITRDSSEAADYETTMVCGTPGDSFERPLALSEYEKAMIELAKQHSTKVIVLVNSDSAMEVEELKQDEEIDSILWTGAPGAVGFLGVADVLCGDANPSGHIADTYAVNSASSIAMANFGVYQYTNSSAGDDPVLTEADKADWFEVETEGIYNGYKYYETRYEDQILGQGNATAAAGSSTKEAWNYANEVSYSFGYGLSYTTFTQTLDSVELTADSKGKAKVTVTNTGDTAGKSVAQLYVQAPYTNGGIEKSAIQLVGFAKTDILEPGQSTALEIEIDPAYFASYDESGDGAWVLEAGDYYFSIGNGAHEALNNVLAAKRGSADGLISLTADETINGANAVKWTLEKTDKDTYSANVENALQDCNINNLIPDTAEYATRSDWTKGWETIDSLTPTEEMMKGLTNSKTALSENGDGVTWGADNGLTIFDMVELDDKGNFAGVKDIDDEAWNQLIEQMTLEEAIQFIAYGGDDLENINSILFPRSYMNDGPVGFTADQIANYMARWTKDETSEPTYVGADNPYADSSMAVMPTEPVVAATFNRELVEREGELNGEDGLWAKESVIIAPGANLHRTPYCARNHEYYSEDSQLTNLMATAFCTGAESKGLLTDIKHFAFNHQETNRSGMSVFFTEQAARENELRCFQGVMTENLAGSSMTAFNRAGVDFVGAKAGLLVQIARNEWGYTGAFVTDMINGADYMNWRDVVFNGGGIALTESAYATSNIGLMENAEKQIAKDTAFQKEMQQGIKYWMYNMAQTNTINGLSATSVLKNVTPWWLGLLIAGDILFGALTVVFIALQLRNRKRA